MAILSERAKHAVNALHEENAIAEQLERKGKKVIRLNQGDPPLYFPTPEYMIEEHVRALRERKTSYAQFSGEPELKEAIAKRYRKHGLRLGHEDVVVTAGVSEALQFLNQSLIDRGDGAILFRPYYAPYVPHLRISGGAPVFENYDEKDGWNIELGHVEGSLRRMRKEGRLRKVKYMLITNPNNPTGTVLRHSVIKEIVDLASEYGVLLVSDEIYDEIVYNGAAFTSIGRLARGVPHVILNGASKNFDATGLRVGYAVVPEHDKASEAVKLAFSNFASIRISANRPAQLALAAAMENGAQHNEAVTRMTIGIAQRVNYAMKLLKENPHLSTVQPNGAFYLFPRIDLKAMRMGDDATFTRKLLLEEHVQVVRGSGFGSPGHFRMIALPPKEDLELAIKRINRFCKRHAR